MVKGEFLVQLMTADGVDRDIETLQGSSFNEVFSCVDGGLCMK